MTTSGDPATSRLRIGNHERSFTLHNPRRARDGQLPLVIVLHGHSPDASGAMMRAWTSFDANADVWGIAVAYPDGYRGGADGRGVTAADAEGVDDIAFLCALIDWSAEATAPGPITRSSPASPTARSWHIGWPCRRASGSQRSLRWRVRCPMRCATCSPPTRYPRC